MPPDLLQPQPQTLRPCGRCNLNAQRYALLTHNSPAARLAALRSLQAPIASHQGRGRHLSWVLCNPLSRLIGSQEGSRGLFLLDALY